MPSACPSTDCRGLFVGGLHLDELPAVRLELDFCRHPLVIQLVLALLLLEAVD